VNLKRQKYPRRKATAPLNSFGPARWHRQ